MGNAVSQLFPNHKSSNRGLTVACAVTVATVGYFFPVKSDESALSVLLNVGHLGAFSIWFGMQTWVSFVAGVTKLNILPRPWFAKAQKALFHRYFMGGLMLNSVMLATHISRNPISGWGKESLHRGVAMIGSLVILIVCLTFEPLLNETIEKMHKMEAEEGLTEVVGVIKSEKLLANPDYQALRKKFLKGHGVALLLNLANFSLSGYQLYLLAEKMAL